MGYRRATARTISTEKYTRPQIRAVIESIGITVNGETQSNFLAYCPFHGNRDTPSFTVSGTSGLYLCFNPGCDESGNLINLVKRLSGRNDFEAMRFIKNKGVGTQEISQEEMLKASQPFEWKPWFPDKLAQLRADFAGSRGETYMVEKRGFALDTCNYFEVGYSEAQRMVTVPLHSPDDIPVGIIGRSIEGKDFKNSQNLPRNKTLFNLNRAKRQGDIAIVTESSFDTMWHHEAGYPNTVGTLGGSISPENLANLDRFFRMIILMTDNDEAGRKLGHRIANTLRHKTIMWGAWDYKEVFPRGVKDAKDMTHDELRHCVENAVSHFEYSSWGLDS